MIIVDQSEIFEEDGNLSNTTVLSNADFYTMMKCIMKLDVASFFIILNLILL